MGPANVTWTGGESTVTKVRLNVEKSEHCDLEQQNLIYGIIFRNTVFVICAELHPCRCRDRSQS